MLPSDPCGPTLRHVLAVGVDGVRFDLLGPDTTPAIWAIGRDGFLAPVVILAEDDAPRLSFVYLGAVESTPAARRRSAGRTRLRRWCSARSVRSPGNPVEG